MNTNTTKNEVQTKWTISHDTNSDKLDGARFGFVPYELTTGKSAARFFDDWRAAHGLKRGEKSPYVVAVKPTNAIRAALLACKIAKTHEGRVSSRVDKVLGYSGAIEALERTDEAEAQAAQINAAYRAAIRATERAALCASVGASAMDTKQKHEDEAAQALKIALEAARRKVTDARRDEAALNAEIVDAIWNDTNK